MSKVDRCPHCGHILPTQTMPKAIENRIAGGAATIEQIMLTARTIKPKATDRQIYAALGMLTRYGRIRHVSYGVYGPVD